MVQGFVRQSFYVADVPKDNANLLYGRCDDKDYLVLVIRIEQIVRCYGQA